MNEEKKTNCQFIESDWKLFRKKIGIWQENYIKKLNQEYIKILSQNREPSEKFWELSRKIDKDKNCSGVIVEMKRSTMISNIICLLNENVIKIEDLDEFSDVLIEQIKSIINYNTFL